MTSKVLMMLAGTHRKSYRRLLQRDTPRELTKPVTEYTHWRPVHLSLHMGKFIQYSPTKLFFYHRC